MADLYCPTCGWRLGNHILEAKECQDCERIRLVTGKVMSEQKDDEPIKGCPPSLRESDHDVAAFIRLAEYARKQGFRIDHIELGSLKLRMFDLRLDSLEGLKPDAKQRSIWAEHGLDDDKPIPEGTAG